MAQERSGKHLERLGLLKTKILIPHTRRQAVPRPRLLARIETGAQRALTLISAPPGFGKTTLLIEWAHRQVEGKESGEPGAYSQVAWLVLEAADNELSRFLRYLAASLSNVPLDLADETWTALLAPQPLPLTTTCTLLLNDLQRVAGDLVLVLDDYQFIADLAVHEAMAFLLDHLPPQIHLIIATRADPPIPLARLRARGEMLELRAADLRFTTEEAVAFLNRSMGLNLKLEDVELLVGRTEGWAVGLQLAALALQGQAEPREYIQSFTGSHHYVLEYLVQEVLSRQSAHVQRFLIQTCLLERLCGSLCDAVTGESDGGATLSGLYRANLFLVPLDPEHVWYRYHQLFADLLHARLQRSEPELIPTLHLRAADWYERSGFAAEAVQHAFRAKEYARAADLIERYGQARWAFSDREFLLLIGQLPGEMLASRPILGVYHAWVLILYGKLTAADALLRTLARQIPAAAADPDIRAMAGFIQMLLVYVTEMLGNRAETLPARQALEFVPEQRLAMRNSADVVYAYLLIMRGEFEPAAEVLLGAVRRDLAANGTTAIPTAISLLARMRITQGRLRQAAGLCREYIKPVQERGPWQFYLPGMLNLVLGDVLREWNQLASAEQEIREGIRMNEAWRIPQASAAGYLALARLQYAQGDVDGASETARQFESLLAGVTLTPDLVSEGRALQVRLWLAQGDLEAASQWAEQFHPIGVLDSRQELEHLAFVRVRMAEGRYGEAQHLLEQLRHSAEAGGRAGRQFEIDLLQALALKALERTPQAWDALETCLARAEPEGYVRVFLDEGERAKELLSAYVDKSNALHRAYAGKLLNMFPGSIPSAPPQAPRTNLIEPLTPREMQVLELICAGHSNREIATELVITVSAVKKHTGNIFGKLGVSSRTQAIVRARELGLISPEA